MGQIQKTITHGIPEYTCNYCGHEEDSITELSWCSKCESSAVMVMKPRTETWNFSWSLDDPIIRHELGQGIDDFFNDMKQIEEDVTFDKLKGKNRRLGVRCIDNRKNDKD